MNQSDVLFKEILNRIEGRVADDPADNEERSAAVVILDVPRPIGTRPRCCPA